jgi:hypothetical protein
MLPDYALLDTQCVISPFGVKPKLRFELGEIHIGANAAICHRAVVCPGATVGPDQTLGPLSSSHELETLDFSDYRAFCRVGFPTGPMWLKVVVGFPILGLVNAIKYLPVSAILYWVVLSFPFGLRDTWQNALDWFMTPERYPVLYINILFKFTHNWDCNSVLLSDHPPPLQIVGVPVSAFRSQVHLSIF